MKKKKRTGKSSRGKLNIPDCKHFTGYKPCFPDTQCYKECVEPHPTGKKILIVNLDAMGNVLATTAILPALKRKYPLSSINWITLKNSAPLLWQNPHIDNIYVWEPESWLILQQLKFDLILNVDKSKRSAAFTQSLRSKEKLGFGMNPIGAIIPLNKEARENYILGLDDHLKFRVNTKTVQQIQCEQFRLKYQRDEYVLELTTDEWQFTQQCKKDAGIKANEILVGLNTGCSELYPNKKMTIEQHVALIQRLARVDGVRLVLVGGPEDTLRNAEIARQSESQVINTPTTDGLRKGLCYINMCDLVISGDSFGMHAAIGLKKHLIVWFGVSCWNEIDLFERGVKLIPEGLHCSPCWKKQCPYNLECIESVDLQAIENYVRMFASSREFS